MKIPKLLTIFLFLFFSFSGHSFEKVIIGDFEPNWVKIENIDDSSILEGSKAIGRLIMPAKRNSACTAFLISEDIAMTNAHCIRSEKDTVDAKIIFNYLSEEKGESFLCDKFISRNKTLDYALIQCQGSPGNIFGNVKLSETESNIGMPIYLIHQNCDYYQIRGCKRSKIISYGTITGLNHTRIFHNADTLAGSSGSPIFSLDTHQVIGIHNNGSGHEETDGRRNGRGKKNLGIKMSLILPEIKILFPNL